MKNTVKKILIGTLSCLSAAFVFAACEAGETVTYYEGEKTWGENYKPDKITFVPVDEEITLDGVLDEEVWAQSEALVYESTGEAIEKKYGVGYAGFADATIRIKTYFGEKGLYIGTVVEDPVIYKTGETAKKWRETALEIYLANSSVSDIAFAKQVWLMPDGSVAFGERMVPVSGSPGYYLTTANGLASAVTIDGEGCNSANNTSYTTETILTWKDLGVEEKPDYVRMFPCAIRVREIPVEGAQTTYKWLDFPAELGANYALPKTWLKFTEKGYVDKTKSLHEINAAAGKYTAEGSIYKDTTPEGSVPAKANEERGFSYTATIKEDGLYVYGEARHDFMKESGASVDSTTYFGLTVNKSNNTNYQMNIFPTAYSGFDNAKYAVVAKDKATDGYNYQSYFEAFVSWDTLSVNGVSIAENPLDSTLYVGAEFISGKEDGTTNGTDSVHFKGNSGASWYWTIAPYGANLSQNQVQGTLSKATIKIPVTKAGMQGFNRFDDSRFEGKPTVTKTEYNGARSVSYTPYYEKGVGVWIKAEARHDVKWTGNSSWWNQATHFEVQFGAIQAYVTSIHGYVNYEGFDPNRSVIWTETNATGSATKYTTYLVGCVPDSWLAEKEMSNDLERGSMYFQGIFSSGFAAADTPRAQEGVAQEEVVFSANGTPTAWWATGVYMIGSEGYFDFTQTAQGETFSLPFVGETDKAFTYSATLNEYGLLIYAEAKTDTALADSALRIQFVMSNGTQMGEQTYFAKENPAGTSWSRRYEEAAPAGSGYARTVKFEIFLDWARLQGNFWNNNSNASDKLYGIDAENLIESEIYIAATFQGTDAMTFNFKKIDVGTNTYTLTQLDNRTTWQEASDWSGTTQTYNYVTKNGLTLQ